jgi:hypothetical protein
MKKAAYVILLISVFVFLFASLNKNSVNAQLGTACCGYNIFDPECFVNCCTGADGSVNWCSAATCYDVDQFIDDRPVQTGSWARCSVN